MSPIVSQGGGGSGSSSTVLFDSTLSGSAASIDTGAGGIPQTQNLLEVWIIARTNDAAATALLNLTVNNDGGANYDMQKVTGASAAASASTNVAQTAWLVRTHGAGGTAGYPTVAVVTIPGYTQTTLAKTGTCVNGTPDGTGANETSDVWAYGYRPTTAISRMTVAAQGASVLVAGSRLLILGR